MPESVEKNIVSSTPRDEVRVTFDDGSVFSGRVGMPVEQYFVAHRRALIPPAREAGDSDELTAVAAICDGTLRELTFPALCEGLSNFVTVTESEIEDAIRLCSDITGITPEGAGAAGLAGLRRLGLDGNVAIVITGSNVGAR